MAKRNPSILRILFIDRQRRKQYAREKEGASSIKSMKPNGRMVVDEGRNPDQSGLAVLLGIREKPVVLLGGSVEDNLFQIPNLEEHAVLFCGPGEAELKLELAACGGRQLAVRRLRMDTGVWEQEGIEAEGAADLNTLKLRHRDVGVGVVLVSGV